MGFVKTLLGWTSVGALLGLFIASFVGPKYLRWYNAPAMGQALCDCIKVTDEITTRLISLQLVGAGVGAALFLVFGILSGIRSRKKAQPVPAGP